MSGIKTVEFGGAYPLGSDIPDHRVVHPDTVAMGGALGLGVGIATQFTARAGVPAFRIPMFKGGRPGLAMGLIWGCGWTVLGANVGYSWAAMSQGGGDHH